MERQANSRPSLPRRRFEAALINLLIRLPSFLLAGRDRHRELPRGGGRGGRRGRAAGDDGSLCERGPVPLQSHLR